MDFIYLSMANYDDMPTVGDKNESIARTIHKAVDGRVSLMAAGTAFTPDDALYALNYIDIIALGRAVIINPDFVVKIREGWEDEIETSVENRLDDLKLPQTLKTFLES